MPQFKEILSKTDLYVSKGAKGEASLDDCTVVFTALRAYKGRLYNDLYTGDCTERRSFLPVCIGKDVRKDVPQLTNAVIKFFALIHSCIELEDIQPLGEFLPRHRSKKLVKLLSLCEGPDSVFRKALTLSHKVDYECVGEDIGSFQDVVTFIRNKCLENNSNLLDNKPVPQYDIILFDPAGNENAVQNWFASSNVAGCISDYAYSCLEQICSLNFNYLILKLRPIHSVSVLKKILVVASSLRLEAVFSNPTECKQELFLILRKVQPLELPIFYGLIHYHISGLLKCTLGRVEGGVLYRPTTLATLGTISTLLQQMHLHYNLSRDGQTREVVGLYITGADLLVLQRIGNVATARHF